MTVGSSKNIQITYLLLGNHSLQAFNILMGVLVLAKSCSEHHHHEVSAKKRIPGMCDILCSSFYYLAHVPFRTISYALLFAHYRFYASSFIVVQVRANLSCKCDFPNGISKGHPVKNQLRIRLTFQLELRPRCTFLV